MDGPPPVPPPLPFPPALGGAEVAVPAAKRRGRPPGSTNKPRAPGEKRPYTTKKMKIAAAAAAAALAESKIPPALGFNTSSSMFRSADVPMKVESTGTSSASSSVPPPHVPASTNGRAPRASKVNAALRMGESARRESSPLASASPEPKPSVLPPPPVVKVAAAAPPPPPPAAVPVPTDPSGPSLAKNPAIAFYAKPKAVKLDMNSVKTKGPRVPKPRTEERAFGLTEAPTFYPTRDEFKDPMEYIRWCGDEGGAKEFGICKIVPPEGWQPPFVMDTETFRFKTRLMRLNSLEAKSRAKINFLEQLFIYHQQQGNSDISTPLVDGKEVDLWLLRKEVSAVGGFNEVTRRKVWTEMAKKIGYTPTFAQQIKVIYQSLILPFDEFSIRARSALTASPLTPIPPSPAGGMRSTANGHSTTNGTNGVAARSSAAATHLTASSLLAVGNAVASGSGTSSTGTPQSAPTSPGPPPMSDTKDSDGIRRTLDFEDGDSSLSEAETEVKVDQDGDTSMSVEPTGPTKRKNKRRVKGQAPIERSAPRRGAAAAAAEAIVGSGKRKDKLKPSLPVIPQNAPKGDLCEVCWKGNHATKILLCDACDAGFHIYCLEPPLAKVPKNESWYCSACLFGTGNEYGFDDGEEHSISSFQKRDTAFREHWFANHPIASQQPDRSADNGLAQRIGNVIVSEHDVETEFWRLVESEEETVEVEYGADVHSTIHGSAAPTFETHPLDPYAIDQWNLNNMPILPGSVLRYIKSNISGMTVPWIYIGFLFSCFAWHNEDHYTSSVNYMHWGETKTWYGIPGEDAGKFEAAIKAEAPDLFEQQPSLLFQLITLMNPGRVKKAGVRVYACDQRANEFVITFPKAYHSGFNQGLNYNEAVNFARPDWLKFGRECVQNYQSYSKPPVFDHNELLISIAEHSHTIDTALWLREHLREMIAIESAARDRLRTQLSTDDVPMSEIVDEVDRPEEEYQCSVCKAFSYLSQVTCSCTKSVACLDHAVQLCDCPTSSRKLRNRFSLASLTEIEDTIISRAAIPSLWTARFRRILTESPGKPSLRALRTLVADADRIHYPLPDADSLKEFVGRCNQLMGRANGFLSKKAPARKAVRKGKGRQSMSVAELEAEAEEQKASDRSVQALADLLVEIEQTGFDAPEVANLTDLLRNARRFEAESAKIFALPEIEQSGLDCEIHLTHGLSLGLDLPQVPKLEKLVQRLHLDRDLGSIHDKVLEVKEVDDFLRKATENGIAPSHPYVVELERRQVLGHAWRDEAKEALVGGRGVEIDTLDRLLDRAEFTPIDPDIIVRVRAMRNKAADYAKTAKAYLDSVEYGAVGPPAKISDVRRLLKKIESKGGCLVDIPDLDLLRKEIKQHDSWDAGLEQLIPGAKDRVKELDNIYQSIKQRTMPDDDKVPVDLKPVKTAEGQDTTLDDKSDAGGSQTSDAAIPHQKFTCVCRLPETPLMLKCRTCGVTYHGDCVEVSERGVRQFKHYQCVTCDPKKLDAPRDTEVKLSELTAFIQSHDVHWRFLPDGHTTVVKIVHKAIRFLEPLSHHLQPSRPRRGTPVNEPEVALLKHYLRKIDQLSIDLEVLSADAEVLDVRNTLLAALQVVSQRSLRQASDKKRTRERKPKWVIDKEKRTILDRKKEANKGKVLTEKEEAALQHATYCLCDNPKQKEKEETITCSNPKCTQTYHVSCVHAPPSITISNVYWRCPLCCLKTGSRYIFAECRLQMQEHVGTLKFVDVKNTLWQVDQLTTVVLEPLPKPNIIVVASKFVPGAKPDEPPLSEQPKAKKAKTAHSATTVSADNAAVYPPPPPAGETYASQGYPLKAPPQQHQPSNGTPNGNANGKATASASGSASKQPAYRSLPPSEGSAAAKK